MTGKRERQVARINSRCPDRVIGWVLASLREDWCLAKQWKCGAVCFDHGGFSHLHGHMSGEDTG